MKRETLEALLGAMDEYMPQFWQYLRAKAKALGDENGLPWYELFAPMGKSDRKDVYKRQGVDDGVGHRLADGGLDVPQLIQCGVQLGGKACRRHPESFRGVVSMINASFSSKFNPFKVGNVSAGALKDNTK